MDVPQTTVQSPGRSAPASTTDPPSADVTSTDTKASLLTLPRELRDIIYDHAFMDYVCINDKTPKSASLMLVCRQLNHEARPAYYKNITFTCSWSKNLAAWLKRLPPRSRHAIENIMYCGSADTWWIKEVLEDNGLILKDGVIKKDTNEPPPPAMASCGTQHGIMS